jgi:hypothetical protein
VIILPSLCVVLFSRYGIETIRELEAILSHEWARINADGNVFLSIHRLPAVIFKNIHDQHSEIFIAILRQQSFLAATPKPYQKPEQQSRHSTRSAKFCNLGTACNMRKAA